MRRCNRCGYRGDGLEYFRRAGNMAGLVLLGLVTYGVGALIFWFARRYHLVCPNCGLGWEHSRLLSDPAPSRLARAYPPLPESGRSLPRGGGFRQVLGGMLMLGGVTVLAMGLAQGAVTSAVVTGAVTGLAGLGVAWWGFSARDSRRNAIRGQLQTRVLRLAARREGVLTVSDVATEFGLGLVASERLLLGMEDGFRVRSEVSPDGIILFEFPEFHPRGRLLAGDDSGEPT